MLFPSLFWGPRSLVVHDCRVQTRCVLSDAKISHTNFITGSTTHLHLEATPLSWDECKAHPKTPQRNQNDRQRLTPRCYGNSRERTVMDGPPFPLTTPCLRRLAANLISRRWKCSLWDVKHAARVQKERKCEGKRGGRGSLTPKTTPNRSPEGKQHMCVFSWPMRSNSHTGSKVQGS